MAVRTPLRCSHSSISWTNGSDTFATKCVALLTHPERTTLCKGRTSTKQLNVKSRIRLASASPRTRWTTKEFASGDYSSETPRHGQNIKKHKLLRLSSNATKCIMLPLSCSQDNLAQTTPAETVHQRPRTAPAETAQQRPQATPAEPNNGLKQLPQRPPNNGLKQLPQRPSSDGLKQLPQRRQGTSDGAKDHSHELWRNHGRRHS